MSHSATAPSTNAPAPSTQPLLVSMISIGVIALTALVLQLLTLPSEVTASLSTASGALVPAMAIRRREATKGKADRVRELVSGTFSRPAVYVLIIAAGLLVLIEYASYFIVGGIIYIGLIAAEEQGLVTAEESDTVFSSDTVSSGVTVVSLLILMLAAVFIGFYVARRIGKRPILWALGAVVLAQAASSAVELVFALVENLPMIDYTVFLKYVAVLVLPVWFGVYRGRKTRALFLATRLFKRLSENDRNAVLGIMDEAQVAQRLLPESVRA